MTKDLCELFAENLRARRRALHLTQKDLAASLAYSEQAISKWETGAALPPSHLLPTLAKLLGTTIDDLMSDCAEVFYYLGIDGGGTKTEFLLTDATGKELRRTVLGASNPNDVGIAATEELLQKGILQVCEPCNLRHVSAFAGIAGASVGENAKHISAFLSRFGFAKVGCGSDVCNALSAGLGTRDGVIYIMGTGSVAVARQGNEQFLAGGYGYLLGDAGSGFSLGRDALTAALGQEDGSAPETLLHPLIQKASGKEQVRSLLSDLYRGGKREIAGYAPVLFEAVRMQDAIATAILDRAMGEVAATVSGAAKHLTGNEIPVVLCGGLCANETEILPVLQNKLANGMRNYRVSVCREPMIRGALYLAGLPRRSEDETC